MVPEAEGLLERREGYLHFRNMGNFTVRPISRSYTHNSRVWPIQLATLESRQRLVAIRSTSFLAIDQQQLSENNRQKKIKA